MKRDVLSLVVMILLTLGTEVLAQDAQWRGSNRDGKYPDTGLLKSWSDGGPELFLRKEGLGNGYSSPLVVEEMIYISGRRDSLDVLTKLDMEGNILWQRNTHQEFEGEFHRWGMTESLLLTDNAVISSPTGERTTVVALDKKDGSLLWESEPQGGVRSYVSPLLIEHNGTNMILITSSEDLMAVAPANGEIFTTSGYDAEAVMVKLSDDGKSAEVKWHNKGSIIFADGLLYIFEEKQGHIGLLEPSTEGFKLISLFRLESRSGPYWAHMAVFNKKLFVRHGEVLFVYDIDNG
ncbi:MAG: PQQ-binding-like beta-propeller repeat protein [Bacteroidales bacterium]|nr:PQQ-binding-like beta-propeller repeat protein [Bacteroidales bacterium]